MVLNCPKCNKPYKTQHGFDNHISICGHQIMCSWCSNLFPLSEFSNHCKLYHGVTIFNKTNLLIKSSSLIYALDANIPPYGELVG